MALFNFFGSGEHKVFDYKPIYYDKDEEERKRKFGAVDGSLEKDKKEGRYVPGSYIRGSMRDGKYQKTRSNSNRAQRIISLVGLILFIAIMFLFIKFYSIL